MMTRNISRMRFFREARRLRQIDVAVQVGISPAWVWHAENTNGAGVSSEVKTKIALILEVPVEELFPL